jgi:ATP-dependent Clp protease protease subunit
MHNTPWVIERSANGERSCDIYSRLLKDRIIFLGEEIDSDVASAVIAQLLYLQLENKESDINMYIMSPGGSVTATLAIYDTIQHIQNDIATYCVGEACSGGAFLLAAGTKGKRFALPSARIMIHQPWGGAHGDASNVEIQANEIKRLKLLLNQRLSKHTGKPLKEIEKDTDRDYWMSPEEAQKYGIIDKVLK